MQRLIFTLVMALIFGGLATGPSAFAQVCSEERVQLLLKAGLTEEEINKVCPQRECPRERIEQLKATGLNDCEVGNICPGYQVQRVAHLKNIGLSELEIQALMPGCYGSAAAPEPVPAPAQVATTPVSQPQAAASADETTAAVISETGYSGGRSGYGRIDVRVVIGSEDDAIDAAAGLASVGMGIWYHFGVHLDNRKVGGGKSIGSQDFTFSQELPVGKHQLEVTARQMAVLIVPGAKQSYEATLSIREGRAVQVKIPADYFFKDVNVPEEMDTEIGGG